MSGAQQGARREREIVAAPPISRPSVELRRAAKVCCMGLR
jgi:hypothetical protein